MDPYKSTAKLPQDSDPECPPETLAMSDLAVNAEDAAVTVRAMPRRFGRYEILKQVGEGAMGAVYQARDQLLERIVALKTPKFTGEEDREDLDRFYREARSAATLCHPNICQIYDIGEIDGIHYISMAYVDGYPLSHFISANKPQAERRIASIIRKCALALDEAHSKGIVHRDLKPANIMIDQRGEPIIMDFGLAWQVGSEDGRLTKSGVILGTPAYMSPEQLDGRPELIGPVSDVYSLGVVMYELLTGQLPFPGTGSIMSIIKDIVSKDPVRVSELRPGVSPAIESICHRAMSRDPEDRFGSMHELAAELAGYLRSDGTADDRENTATTPAGSGGDTRATIEESGSEKAQPYVITERVPRESLERRVGRARECFRQENYADAAVILEALSQVNDPDAAEYVLWARHELPKARTKARQQARSTSSLRQPEHPTVSAPHPESPVAAPVETTIAATTPSAYTPAVSQGAPSSNQQQPMPPWVLWVIAAPIAVLILLVLAILLTSWLQ